MSGIFLLLFHSTVRETRITSISLEGLVEVWHSTFAMIRGVRLYLTLFGAVIQAIFLMTQG